MGCFGTMDAISKFLVQHYPAPFVLWMRHIAAVPLVLLFVAGRHPLRVMRSSRPWLQLLRISILIVEMTLVVAAFRTMPLADIHAILAVTPLIVTALSVPMLGERVGWRRWLAVLLGFLGVLVILRPGMVEMHPAALVALFCTVLYAIYNILTRMVASADSPETSFLLQTVVGAFLLTLVGPFFWITPPLAHLPLVLALAALGATGHYLLVRALSLAPAVVVQPFTYTLLVWAVIIGYVVFGNLPDLWTILGAVIVVGAGIYTAWREHQRRQLA
jgi:drug/metabolite transporter (DMT)-like permease